MVLVLVFAVAGRALNARALLAPAWVDGLHHTVLTRLISENGGVPGSYLPYLPVEHLHYHFGFHATAAALTWLTPLDPAQAVLVAGQALSALAVLAAYTLATWLFRRRWAGVGAALVAGSLYYLPAYYVSWGGTHLAGLRCCRRPCRPRSRPCGAAAPATRRRPCCSRLGWPSRTTAFCCSTSWPGRSSWPGRGCAGGRQVGGGRG